MTKYKTNEPNEHLNEEYLQWARIMSRGNPVHGMLIVFVQKLCTAFHELAPASEAGALNEDTLDFFRERMTERTKTVLDALSDNDLDTIEPAENFKKLFESIKSTKNMAELVDLSEIAHAFNHALCDWLEKV